MKEYGIKSELMNEYGFIECFSCCRLLREAVSSTERSQSEQEEDFDETRLEKPYLQRVHDVLGSQSRSQRE